VKFKYFAAFLAILIIAFTATSALAQEGETEVVDEVIAQVNDDVITLSMLKTRNERAYRSIEAERA
jgi:hypothetical protein